MALGEKARVEEGLRNTYEQSRMLVEVREMAASLPDWGLFGFDLMVPAVDSVLELLPLTLRNLAIACAVMFAIAALLIPSLVGTLLITLSIVSIDLGVIGFLSLWNIHLDSISSVTILMSVGFAVDLSAHITHGYLAAAGPPSLRAIRALQTFGQPVLQGGLSSLAGLIAIAIEPHYIVDAFVRGTFLCILLGLLHSLLFLPVALARIMPLFHHDDATTTTTPTTTTPTTTTPTTTTPTTTTPTTTTPTTTTPAIPAVSPPPSSTQSIAMPSVQTSPSPSDHELQSPPSSVSVVSVG